MKNIILIIWLFISLPVFAQVLPDPSGDSGSWNDEDKIIKKCDQAALATAIDKDWNTVARRFHFDLAIWPELYQLKGRKAKIFGCWPSFSCMDCDECDISWNKFGRITYLNGTFVNDYKLHVGWRADPENIEQLKLFLQVNSIEFYLE